MDISIAFSTISIMGIIIFLGVMTAKNITVTIESRRLLTFIIIYFALPSVIMNGVLNTDMDEKIFGNILSIFVISLLFNIVGLLIGWAVCHLVGLESIKARKVALLAALGNTGFIGIPLCANIFGPTGGVYAAIYDAGLDVILFSVGIMMLKGTTKFTITSLKEVLNPPLYALVVSFAILFLDIKVPKVVTDLVSMLSNLSAPLAMLYIGLIIPEMLTRRSKIGPKMVMPPLILKLLVVPIILIVILPLISSNLEVNQVVFIQVGMPTFMLSVVLFAKYTDEDDSATLTTIYSTILSLVTLPLIIYFFIS